MSIVNVFTGQQGDRGGDGIDGVGISDIDVIAPTAEVLSVNSIGENVTFARDREATYTDRYGVTAVSPAALVEQALYSTNDLTVQWVDLGNSWELISTNNPDPDGGNNANNVIITNQSGTFGFSGESYLQSGQLYRVSVWVKVLSGDVAGVAATVSGREQVALDFDPLEADWQRVTGVISSRDNGGIPNPSTLIHIAFDTASADVLLWQFNATLGRKIYDTIQVLEPPISAPTITLDPSPKFRQSDKGTLIEGDQRNLATNSDILSYWQLSGIAQLLPYDGLDVFGDRNSTILVDGTGATEYTLTNELDTSQESLAEGQTVYVSFYMALLDGDQQSIEISAGGGTPELIPDLTPDLVRYFFELTYGELSDITVYVRGTGNSKLLLQGLQVTSSPHGSYIPTGEDSATRPSDSVTAPFDLSIPNTGAPWSLLFDYADLQITSDKKTIIASDGGEFDLSISGSNITISIGAESVDLLGVIAGDSGRIGIAYDGAEIALYNGFDLVAQQAASFNVVTDDTVTYGAAHGGQNAIGAYLSNVRLFDTALTQNQIKYYTNEAPNI